MKPNLLNYAIRGEEEKKRGRDQVFVMSSVAVPTVYLQLRSRAERPVLQGEIKAMHKLHLTTGKSFSVLKPRLRIEVNTYMSKKDVTSNKRIEYDSFEQISIPITMTSAFTYLRP